MKQRQRGLDEARYVESLVLNAAGGDCLEDCEHLRSDRGLAELIGHEMPSAEAARKFLYQFHEDDRMGFFDGSVIPSVSLRAISPG